MLAIFSYLLVTNGSLTLSFFMSERIVRTRCLLFLVINDNLTLFFDMGINSIGAYKLSAIVSRIFKKKEAFISKLFLCLFSSSL